MLMKREFSRQIFEKYSNIKFHESSFGEAELFHADRQTDRHDAANCRLSQFCERAHELVSLYPPACLSSAAAYAPTFVSRTETRVLQNDN